MCGEGKRGILVTTFHILGTFYLRVGMVLGSFVSDGYFFFFFSRCSEIWCRYVRGGIRWYGRTGRKEGDGHGREELGKRGVCNTTAISTIFTGIVGTTSCVML
jgi:hypothetical protein